MRFLVLLLLAIGLTSCGGGDASYEASAPSDLGGSYLHTWHDALTDVLVTDIVSPPVASRMYVYPHIAAYEVLASLAPDYLSLSDQLGFEVPETPEEAVDPELASVTAFVGVAEKLVFGPAPLQAQEAALREQMQNRLSRAVYERSLAYGEAVASAVNTYSESDNYAQTRTMPGYTTITEEPARWQPTPPDYQGGLEPNWNALRPFALTSADEFAPDPPTPFDTTPGSPFMEEVMQVYEAVNNATEEHLEIAKFWDCNPLVSSHDGHFVSFSKKITPGGHWMAIAGIAARKVEANAMRASEAYTLTALALADGFISCWDEKYRSVLTRPVTVINKHIDPTWAPILQTPAFPEYTSGHSVVSGAASTILTELFGEPFSFADSSEVEFGLPVRHFESFRHAADEAAISRLYGGIHYLPAIENGVAQGREVGQRVLETIHTRESTVLAQHETAADNE